MQALLKTSCRWVGCAKLSHSCHTTPSTSCQQVVMQRYMSLLYTSFLRWIEATKCSQTSGGISSTGYTLNNSTPCLSYWGRAIHICAHARTHAKGLRHPPFFHLLCPGPGEEGVGRVPGRRVAKYLVSQEVVRLLTSHGEIFQKSEC